MFTVCDVCDDRGSIKCIKCPRVYNVSAADVLSDRPKTSYRKEYEKRRNEMVCIDLTKIKNVIFNNPATIIIWADGSKTVVKACAEDIFDPEKGFAMAVIEKLCGSKAAAHQLFKKWVPEKEKPCLKTEEISINRLEVNNVIA